jgi:hypothetical protein
LPPEEALFGHLWFSIRTPMFQSTSANNGKQAFPEEFQICCWIGGDIAFLPRRKIIDFDVAFSKGYSEKPMARKSTLRPLTTAVERDTQIAMEI